MTSRGRRGRTSRRFVWNSALGGTGWARGLIGAHDLIIAGTAIAIGYRVATANPRDFTRIPGLGVEVWGG